MHPTQVYKRVEIICDTVLIEENKIRQQILFFLLKGILTTNRTIIFKNMVKKNYYVLLLLFIPMIIFLIAYIKTVLRITHIDIIFT